MRILLVLLSVVLIAGLPMRADAAEPAASGVLLLQKHTGKGLTCAGCHAENPPSKAVAMPKCLACHGSYDSLADKTEGKGPHNPHASHQGALSCESCHHVHRRSENYCSQCHQFPFDVP